MKKSVNNAKVPDYFGFSFCEDIEEILPNEIIEFWGMKNAHHIFQNMSYSECIRNIIASTFNGIEQEMLPEYLIKLQVATRRRKADWYKMYQSYMNYDFKDPKHPLALDYLLITNMQPMEYIQKYKDMSIEDIMKEKIAEKNELMDAWKSNKSAMFINYPAMIILSESQKENAFSSDVISIISKYIKKTIKFDFGDNSKSIPSPIVSKPIFTFSSSKIPLEEINGVVQNVITNEENGNTFSVIPVSKDTSELIALNKFDYEVYQVLTKSAESKGRMDNGRLVIGLNYYELATKIYSYAVNNKDISNVKNSVAKLAARRFVHRQGTQITEYVLIDSIKYNETDESKAEITLGSVVTDAIVQKNIISISKKDALKIETKYGKAFMHILQKLRFIVYRDHPDDLSENVTISFFESAVFFNTNLYSKKVKIIIDALDDYRNHEVLIKDFKFEKKTFFIEFLPLSQSDSVYFTDWLKINQMKND